MNDIERNLAETFGPAAPYSDYKVGNTIRYRDRHSGNIYSGEIFWIAEAGQPGLSGVESLPLRYICQRAGWAENSFPDIVYSQDILTQEPEEPTLRKCPFGCGGYHYVGQELYCRSNPDRP